MEIVLLLLGVVIVVLVVVLVILAARRPSAADLSTPLQNLTSSVQQGQSQVAVLAERIAALTERVSRVEEGQVSGTTAIREALSRAENDLTALQTHLKARQELETRTAQSIHRLETIIAGTQTKGAAGENILEVVFAKLPPEWQVRDFRVGDKTVEFALRLPNNLVLPIDSKWAATNLLEEFIAADDPTAQQKLKSQIEQAVRDKAKEVRKYIDPNLTVTWGVAALPDAVFDLCGEVQAEVFQMNVVLVSYSMFIPYLLLVFQTILKSAQNIDLQRIEAYLHSSQESIRLLQEELEGRMARAITMLNNSRGEMSVHLSKLHSSLTSLQLGVGEEALESGESSAAVSVDNSISE